ncbi:MAG TPA: glycoside hydrolase family 3 N-terminal domain-containing protein, partial [Polyangiaceae bacterium]|nr:glycoside hydrolase family 3 N-terminal domain-containing protein [Polyangiaceae bacterium]
MYAKNARFVPRNAELDERVEALLARLTLEEKIDLLGGDPKSGATRAIERAKVPAFRMADGPVGVHWWCDASTAYPAVLCAVASWDRTLMGRLGRALGSDCRARGVHYLLAPGVNLYRSPLCGRNFEYMGEDPYLASRMVVEYVRGVQAMGVATTVKHYALNFQEYARHTVSSDADERTLREMYLPAFEAAVREGGTAALMTAYNLVNGVHCSEHVELIRKILKDEWGFDGVVMSDWVSCYDAVSCANAGLDLEMPFAQKMTREKLLPAIERGQVTAATINDKVRRQLRVAACFGWLDHEQKDDLIPLDNPETEQVALDVARSGFVLLKNDKGLLPFDRKKVKKLALLGGHAHPAIICAGGSAYTPPYRVTSFLDGLQAVGGAGLKIVHELGLDPDREYARARDSEFETESGQAGIVAEYFKNDKLEGKPALERVDPRVWLEWPGKSPADGFGQTGFSVRWTGRIRAKQSGKHRLYIRSGISPYRLYVAGELKIDAWSGVEHQSKLFTLDLELVKDEAREFVLEYARNFTWEDILFGWEPVAAVEADYQRALAAADKADAVVLCVGFTRHTESEGFDRSFGLLSAVDRFIADVAKVNPNTVVLLTAGGGVSMTRWIDKVRGLLHVFYPGQSG